MSHNTPPPPPADDSSTDTKPAPPPARTSRSTSSHSAPSAAIQQATIDRLTQTNDQLLDLLKKQQAVLEDIQYDRRLQNRQIQLVEVKLEDTLQLNAKLQAKIAALEATAAAPRPTASTPNAPVAETATQGTDKPPITEAVAPTLPLPPSTYLPAPESEGAPGTMSWHRLFTLSGDDMKNSEMFHIQGKQWRVLWHNQDKPGVSFKNTSALFIYAFPKNDSIPKKICSKVGTGGDSTELTGSGDYYLKIEASGGHWELAVEDFR